MLKQTKIIFYKKSISMVKNELLTTCKMLKGSKIELIYIIMKKTWILPKLFKVIMKAYLNVSIKIVCNLKFIIWRYDLVSCR